ncbi:hypothetical protein HPB52_009121 [Rhipicephalus sanguineus]|uniref:RRM domain-containing protein n=1 Tax=Rhipicephalus sanguineus TaxID=34632 RepID=A0A9D4YNG2_RHISA|nr:hypothetical protein HPB52_009121 [Rhipicephalus sanguineus]
MCRRQPGVGEPDVPTSAQALDAADLLRRFFGAHDHGEHGLNIAAAAEKAIIRLRKTRQESIKYYFSAKCAFVNYANKEEAVAAVHSLRGANLKGAAIKASYCGGRWNSPARPQLQPDTLDIRRVPKAYQNKNKLAALFPTGEVLKVQKDG